MTHQSCITARTEIFILLTEHDASEHLHIPSPLLAGLKGHGDYISIYSTQSVYRVSILLSNNLMKNCLRFLDCFKKKKKKSIEFAIQCAWRNIAWGEEKYIICVSLELLLNFFPLLKTILTQMMPFDCLLKRTTAAITSTGLWNCSSPIERENVKSEHHAALLQEQED